MQAVVSILLQMQLYVSHALPLQYRNRTRVVSQLSSYARVLHLQSSYPAMHYPCNIATEWNSSTDKCLCNHRTRLLFRSPAISYALVPRKKLFFPQLRSTMFRR